MKAARNDKTGNGWIRPVVAVGLFAALLATTGCDTATMLNYGGLVDVGLTSALGLPEYSPDYWSGLGMGTQNVWSWGGLADPNMTSSLGLPLSPWVYWQ